MNTTENLHIRTIILPENNDQTYDGQTAIVSGFGLSWIRVQIGEESREIEEEGSSDGLLRYLNTTIVPVNKCQSEYVKPISTKHICAKAQQREMYDHEGVCSVIILKNVILFRN